MSSLGLATLLGGLCGGVPMNATSAMTDMNKEGIKGDPLAARYTVPSAIAELVSLVGGRGAVTWFVGKGGIGVGWDEIWQ